MRLVALDWVIVVVSIAISFAPAILLARRAGRSTSEFFASGRAAPWWLAGVSMVATTFSTDTPNLVTNFVRDAGVANNWQWWSFMLTDLIQFGIAMTGSVAAAVFALRQPQVGGLTELFRRTDPRVLNLVPDFSDWGLMLTVMIVPLTVSIDRKSTRLNSSHRCISYAVFCLKKKRTFVLSRPPRSKSCRLTYCHSA